VRDELGEAIGALAQGEPSAGRLARVARVATASARSAGVRAVASGRWLTEVALDAAPHVPIRDLDTLRAHHAGLSGGALAGALIRNASRASAAVGAAAGALVSAEELAPPAWVAVPVELLVETLAIAAIEMKLIAELQEVYGRPVTGLGTERALALARAWAERRGVNMAALARPGGLGDLVGQSARREVARL
jgi:hypothetical protein